MTSPRVTLDDFLAWMETQKGWRLKRGGHLRIGEECPLQKWTGERYKYRDVAVELGMTRNTATEIIYAADNSVASYFVVRFRLLRAAGVEEGR